MVIEVEVVQPSPVFQPVPPDKKGPGHRFVFSDNLVLRSIDGNAPPGPARPKAGTQSGFVTTVRITKTSDEYISGGSILGGTEERLLSQYEGTYWFLAVAGLQKGQVTARGVNIQKFGVDGRPVAVETPTFAITGGTGPYANARGQITETGNIRRLDITM